MDSLPAIHFIDNYLLAPTNPVTVALIGAGGTGSQVLTSLSRINVSLLALGHPGISVTVFDDDKVSKANCGRQLFTESEIGLNKAAVLINRVNRFFGTDWKAETVRIEIKQNATNLLRANILISCVDTVSTRFQIEKIVTTQTNRQHRDKLYYWLDFGNGKDSGQVVVSTAGKIKQPESKKFRTVDSLPSVTEEYRHLLKNAEEDNTPSCSMAEALSRQDLFINSSLCAMGSSILWSMFSEGMLCYRGFFLNLKSLKSEPIKIN